MTRARGISLVSGCALAAAAAAAVAATSAKADGPCQDAQCRGHFTPVRLCVISDDLSHGLQWAAAARECSSGVEAVWASQEPNAYVVSFSGALHTSLRDVILRTASQCKKIADLKIVSHGAVGMIGLNVNHDMLRLIDIEPALGGLSCAMADNATIEFGGCNVGRGCRGEDFLAEVGRVLLQRGGGTVTGNNFYSSTILPAVIPHFSLDGQVREVHIQAGNPSGPVPEDYREGDTYLSSTYCLDYVNRLMGQLAPLAQLDPGCRVGSQPVAAEARLDLAGLRELQSLYLSPDFRSANHRVGFDDVHRRAASLLATAYAHGEWLAAHVQGRKTMTCPAASTSPSAATGVDRASVTESAPDGPPIGHLGREVW